MEKIMTVDELYKYITSQLTPEEALKRMLTVTVDQYKHLRGLDEGGHPEMIIASAALELGWKIGFKNDDDINGLVVGTDDFLDDLMDYSPMKREQFTFFRHKTQT